MYVGTYSHVCYVKSNYDVNWVINITDVGHLVSDADEGEDSELLAAMGYIPHTARASISVMGRKQVARAAQQASAAKEEET